MTVVPRSAGPLDAVPRGRRVMALLAAAALVVAYLALAALPVSAADTLLSQGRPATASSVENAGTPASAAVDGNAGTRWSSGFSDPQWIQVDLGASASVTRVVLQWEAAYATAFQLQVSPDAAAWTTVYSTTTSTGGTQTLTVAGTGRFVRMFGTARSTQYGYSLFEFAVYGSTGGTGGCGPTNAAQGRPATASSAENAGTPASAAVDGNAGTRWSSAFSDPQWIQVDLGSPVAICQVVLQWEAAYATAFQIQVSTDAATWTSVYSTTTAAGGTQTLAVSGTGRYIRMYGTARFTQYGYSLWEFSVFTGTAGGDTTPPGTPGTPTLVSSTPSSATIAWTATTDNVGVTGYDIFRDGQLCAQVNGSTLTGTCANLNPKTTYGFYVNARDAAGNLSQPSGTLPVTTPGTADQTPPTAPTAVHTTSVTSTSIGLAWTASTDNVGVTGYTVYNVVGGTRVKIGAAGTSPSASLTGLTPTTAYHLQVTASDLNKNESAASTPTLDVTTGSGSCTQPICSVTQVGTDDDVVWGLVTLPDGTILYNERDVHDIVHLNPVTGAKKTIGTVPNVESTDGEGGLTGLEINPASFASDHWLYIMHTSPTDNRIVRIGYDPAGDTLLTGTEQILVSGLQRNKFHDGGRLRFSPDGRYLYAGTGDAQNGDNAQNTSILNGKVLRINPDGSIPADNPFGNAVWSYGHRNVQGLAFDSRGQLWEQEFGNNVMDETNLIVRGGNYGWPACEGTTGTCDTPGFIAPAQTYPVEVGSCSGIAIVHDVLFVACERGTRLYREVISGTALTASTQLLVGTYGRLRSVEPAPGGGLWLATSNGGDKDSIPHNSTNQIFQVTLGS
jgi:glucose/arabinose dehydrogenase